MPMHASGWALWIATSIVIALVALALLWAAGHRNLFYQSLYVLPAALLGAFIGSEGFKDAWGWLGSEKGPEVGSFYVITGIILGAFITLFAALASIAPPPAREEVYE